MNTIIQTSIVMTYEELDFLTGGRFADEHPPISPEGKTIPKKAEDIFRLLMNRGLMKNAGDGYIMDAALYFLLGALRAPGIKTQRGSQTLLCECSGLCVVIEPYRKLPGGCMILPFKTKTQAMRYLEGCANGEDID